MHKAVIRALLGFLGLSALIGCHPAFTGSLVPREGNGQGPTPPAGQAQITLAIPFSVPAGSAAFTLTVTGLNFLPTTTVLWDNTSLTTTYVSSTTLTAQVPASLIAKPTSVVPLIPSPTLTFNFGTTFTVTVPPVIASNSFSVSKVEVAANDLEWDAVSQQFYVSIASGNGTNTNSIAALNPQTGVLSSFTSTGSEPGKLAVSTDGAYIYAGLNSAGSINRFTLPALLSDIAIPLGTNTYDPYYAIDIQPEPGSPHAIAVSRGIAAVSPREQGGVVIYDDAVARPQSVPRAASTATIDALVWNPNGLSLYGIDSESGAGVSFMSVSSAGVQFQSEAQDSGSGSSLHFDATTGRLYSDSGVVTDPTTKAVSSNFPFNVVQGGLSTAIMVPDGKLNIAYFLGQTLYNSGAAGNYVIEAFDLTHSTFLGVIPIGLVGTPSKMIRWGSNGLAVLTGDPGGRGAVGDGVYLISGPFVTSPAP